MISSFNPHLLLPGKSHKVQWNKSSEKTLDFFMDGATLVKVWQNSSANLVQLNG